MTARCDLTELDVTMCAHCLGHTDHETPRQLPAAQLGSTVKANFPGRCTSCGVHYPAGTTIRRSPDGWTADCCTEET